MKDLNETATAEAGTVEAYVDKKRYFWILSVFWPATPLIGLYLVSVTGWSIWYGTVLILWYLAVPLLDAMFGEDFSNPPESAVADLEKDRYYRVLTYLTVPMHYAALIGSCWWVATQPINAFEFIALALSLGVVKVFDNPLRQFLQRTHRGAHVVADQIDKILKILLSS
tara:strand:- start:358 stop:864 length:507 start_codon:yes stop_codon:yes gene_type:complete